MICIGRELKDPVVQTPCHRQEQHLQAQPVHPDEQEFKQRCQGGTQTEIQSVQGVEAGKGDQRGIHRYCLCVWDGTEEIIHVALVVVLPLWWDLRLVRAQRTSEGNEINFLIL